MIDLDKAKKVFNEYVKRYNSKNGKVALKIEHISRVSSISKKIAEKLELDEEDIKLAELIGLLHDIGRFEQIRVYNTFVDKDSINHGEYGVKVLFEDGLIREFLSETKYDNIIKKAILNHNRSEIEKDLTPREELHSKIIRDADKIDILYLVTYEDVDNTYGSKDISNQEISPKIYNEFIYDRKICYTDMKTNADIFVAHIAYIFDFNYKFGLQVIKDNNYIDAISKKVNFQNKKTIDEANQINRFAIEYINNKLEEEA